jgi:hypothetical protein
MRRLEIDFRRSRAPAPWAGRVLFAVAVALAADVGFSYYEVDEALRANREALVKAQPKTWLKKVSPEEVETVRETVERIGMPWDQLFGALEAAASSDVSLSGIEPDLKSGTVVISGDGKDYLAALSYVLNLSRQEALSRVQLVRHEATSNDPQGPVAFAVSAAWNGARQ